MTIAENIKNTIISDLAKITTANGYDITIQEIKDKATLITEVTKYPSAFVLLGTDKIGEELEENEIRYLDIIIGVHCNIEDDDKIIGSLLKHFQQDISILDNYWTSLDTIDGIINLSVVEKNYNINWHNNKKTVGILLTVKYYQELRTVSSGVNPITPPSILSAYSLTSHTHSLIDNDLEVNGKLTGKELRAGSDLSPATSGKIYLFDAPAGEYAQVMEQGDTKLILGVSTDALDINSSKVVINSPVTSSDLFILPIMGSGDSNLYMFDSPNAEYKQIIKQGDGELYLSNTGNELKIISKDEDNANIYLNKDPITNLFATIGHTHTVINNDLSVNGTLSANQLYFTSTTAVELTVTGQELNFLGSVSITGDNVLPTANHLLQTYKPSESTPCFIVSSAGNVGIGTNSTNYPLYVVGQIYSTTRVQGGLAQMQTSNGYATFGSNATTTNIRINTDADGSGSNGITVLSSGNVGINTTNPTSKFYVYGDVDDWGSTEPFATIYNGEGSSAEGNVLLLRGGANSSSSYILKAQDYSGNTNFIINGAGNVGIGTSAANYKLHLLNNTQGFTHEKTSAGYFYATGFSGNNPYFTYYATGLRLGYGTSTGAAPTIDTMFLASNGNVAIGTTGTPTKRLEIQTGTLTSGGNKYGLKLKGTYVNGDWTGICFAPTHVDEYEKGAIIYKAQENSTLAGQLQFLLAPSGSSISAIPDTDAKMIIDYKGNVTITGNVGIGATPSASWSLNLGSHINLAAGKIIDWSSGNARIGESSYNLVFYNWTGSALVETFRSTSANRIGIGTTTPAEKLSISGNISVTGEVTAPNIKLTNEGGYAISLTAGETLVKGNVVSISANTGFVRKIVQDVPDPIGVSLSSVTAGQQVWIVCSGIADVLFNTSVTAGYLARGYISADSGYVAGTALAEAVPTSPFASDKHFYEIGHCLETKSTSGLAKAIIHFN